jgi:hypothetical protein
MSLATLVLEAFIPGLSTVDIDTVHYLSLYLQPQWAPLTLLLCFFSVCRSRVHVSKRTVLDLSWSTTSLFMVNSMEFLKNALPRLTINLTNVACGCGQVCLFISIHDPSRAVLSSTLPLLEYISRKLAPLDYLGLS